MSQNTHNVRTRREQISTYPESVCVGRYSGDTWQLELDGDDLDADRLVEGPVLYVRCDIAHRCQTEAEARGAAEERDRLNAAGVDLRGREERANSLLSMAETWFVGTIDCPNRTPGGILIAAMEAVKHRERANAAELEARVKELEKALSFYADPSNYIDSGFFEGDPDLVTPKCIPVLRHGEDGSPCDCGDTASAALTREGWV